LRIGQIAQKYADYLIFLAVKYKVLSKTNAIKIKKH